MKNLKKETKFKLEHFEVAKLKNAIKINGGNGTGDDTITRASNYPTCPKDKDADLDPISQKPQPKPKPN